MAEVKPAVAAQAPKVDIIKLWMDGRWATKPSMPYPSRGRSSTKPTGWLRVAAHVFYHDAKGCATAWMAWFTACETGA